MKSIRYLRNMETLKKELSVWVEKKKKRLLDKINIYFFVV